MSRKPAQNDMDVYRMMGHMICDGLGEFYEITKGSIPRLGRVTILVGSHTM